MILEQGLSSVEKFLLLENSMAFIYNIKVNRLGVIYIYIIFSLILVSFLHMYLFYFLLLMFCLIHFYFSFYV